MKVESKLNAKNTFDVTFALLQFPDLAEAHCYVYVYYRTFTILHSTLFCIFCV